MSDRYFRPFTLDPSGILTSATKTSPYTDGRFPSPSAVAPECPKGHPVRPSAGCRCGLYLWNRWPTKAWGCLRSRSPRLLGEVAVTEPIEPSDGHCPLYPRGASVRVARWELLTLWVLAVDHCLICRADPDTREITDEELAALQARYQVPVGSSE